MRNETECLVTAAAAAVKSAEGGVEGPPRGLPMRGVAGRLRPYRDVRAGFEPWRRVALLAWAGREEVAALH